MTWPNCPCNINKSWNISTHPILLHLGTQLTLTLPDKAEIETTTHLEEDIDHPKVCQDAQGQQEVKGSRLDSIGSHGGFRYIIEHPLRITFVSLKVGDSRLIGVSGGAGAGRDVSKTRSWPRRTELKYLHQTTTAALTCWVSGGGWWPEGCSCQTAAVGSGAVRWWDPTRTGCFSQTQPETMEHVE